MTKAVLWLLDRFAWLFVKFKIDFVALKAIVEIKLITENRRLQSTHKKQQKQDPDNQTFLKMVLVQVFFSFIYGLGIFFVQQKVFNMMLMSFAFIMFMIAFNMISDFVEILFDTNDNVILLPKPIDSRTIWMARLIHILVFLGILTVANSVGLIVFISIKLGLAVGVLFFVFVLLLCLLTVFLSSILYLALTRLTHPEKLKDIIIYLQIFFTIGLSIGYQFIARINKGDLDDLQSPVDISTWHYFVPPAWFAIGIESFVFHTFRMPYPIFWSMVVFIPFLSLYFLNRFLAPFFAKGLSAISFSESIIANANETLGQRIGIFTYFKNVFTKSLLERSSFELVWKIISRDRRFKLRTYPTFGMLVYFMYKYYSDANTIGVSRLLVLYYATFTLYVITQQIFVSDDWKAAWIYRVAPIANPGEILIGAYKSVILKYILPLYLLVGAALYYREGVRVFDDIFLNISVTLLYLSAGVFQERFKLPFSIENDNASKKGANWVRIAVIVFVLPVMGYVHYFIAQTLLGTLVVGSGFYIISIILFNQYKYISWDRIKI
jgi:hypothetical protein